MKGVWLLTLLLPYSAAKCMNDCSQHGLCSGPGTDAFCICEPGYVTEDCSEQLCPKGDDPMTISQNYRQITISTGAASGHLGGHFDFTFMGQTIGFDASATALSMKYAFEALPSVEEIEVRRGGTTTDGGATYTLTFLAWPKGKPTDNNLYEHDGFPPLSFFKCMTEGITGVSKPFCEVKDYGELNPLNVVEHVSCSRHGTCDSTTGECKCDRGWSGEACDDNADDDDHTLMYAEGPFFSGAIARLAVHKNAAKDFDFIKVSASDGRQEVMTLDGSGDMYIHRGNFDVQQGDVTLAEGNLNVNKGNVELKQGALSIVASSQGESGLKITLDSTELDHDLKQLGLGHSLDQEELIGVEYDYKSLLTVSAPMMTMADLLTSDEFGGFDYVTIGPQPVGSDVATWQGMSLRRETAFFRIDHTGMCIIGGEGSHHNDEQEEEGQKSYSIDEVRDGFVKGGNGLLVKNGHFYIQKGNGIFGGHVEIEKSLQVNGSDGLNLNQGPLIVRSGNALIRSPIKTQPALRIEASSSSSSSLNHHQNHNDEFQSSLLHLNIPKSVLSNHHHHHSNKKQPSFIRASLQSEKNGQNDENDENEEIMFDVSHEGLLSTSGGVKVQSGGINIDSGGLQVQHGGIKVDGGISINSGSLDMNTPEGFQVQQGGISSISNSSSMSAISASVTSDHFLGSVLTLEAMADPNEVDFDYFMAKNAKKEQTLIKMDGFGRILGQTLESKGNVEVQENLMIGGHFILGNHGGPDSTSTSSTIIANDLIIIPPCGYASTSSTKSSSFIKITSDHATKLNKLILPIKGTDSCDPYEGQLLLIYNGDEEITSGEAAISPGRAVLFIFSQQAGPGWIPFTTLDARGSSLEKITFFSALNDLDIGEFSFKAKQLIAGGQVKTQLAYYGAGGLLTGDPSLTFHNGLLTTNKINMKQVDSNGVDFMGTPLTNIRIESGSIQGISILRTQQIFVESLQPVGTLLMVGANGAIVSSSSVFVSELEKSGVSGANVLSTLVTPALRISELASGGLVSVGVHGELTSWDDVKLNLLSNVNYVTGDAAPISAQRASELKNQGTDVTAELQTDRMKTATLIGTVPSQAQLNAMAATQGSNQITSSGRREIRIFGDVLMDGFELRGAAIVGSSLLGVEELGVASLTMNQQKENTLAYFAANSSIQSFAGSSVGVDGVLHFDSLRVDKLASDLDCNGFLINNAKLKGGSLNNMVAVSTDELVLSKLASSSSSSDLSMFALLDGQGKLHTTSLNVNHKHDLSYDISKQTLHVTRLGPFSFNGNVDGSGFHLKNIILEESEIKTANNIESNKNLGCKNDLDVGGDASISGTLVVGGTVMGSGPYVDSSDERFKYNIQDLFISSETNKIDIQSSSSRKTNALDVVSKLHPVKYYFNQSSHEKKQFPQGEEIGLIAQEVELVIPQIVSTDAEGYKGVAYSRLTPVLVSAIQEMTAEVKSLREENNQLNMKVNRLEKELLQQDSSPLMQIMMERIIALEEKLASHAS